MLDLVYNNFAKAYARFEAEKNIPSSPWLTQCRQQGKDYIQSHVYPTKQEEDFRYTALRPIRETEFHYGTLPSPVDQTLLNSLLKDDEHHLVFVDGIFSRDLSTQMASESFSLLPLSLALLEHEETIKKVLAKTLPLSQNTFTQLNSSFLKEGYFIHLAKGVQCKKKINLIYVVSQQAQAEKRAIFPRNVICLEDQSEAYIVEQHLFLAEAIKTSVSDPQVDKEDGQNISYLCNGVSDIFLGNQAKLCLAKIQTQQKESIHFHQSRIYQSAQSQAHFFHWSEGAHAAREAIHVALAGEAAEVYLNGLLKGCRKQHGEFFLFVDHAASKTKSQQFYKLLAADQSKTAFSGKIKVRQGVKKISAQQLNKNLLLGDKAEILTRPQLEIDADDVKCSHGATIGRLRDEEIFYLMSRGVPRLEAESILCQAFAHEAYLQIKDTVFKDWIVEKLLTLKLSKVLKG